MSERTESSSRNGPQNPGVSLSTSSVGAPVVCLRLLTDSHIMKLRSVREKKEKDFESLMNVWEMGREKHERSLKPRLGSSDCSGKVEE